MSVQLAVQAENLVKTYDGDVQAVKGITFQVAAGEAFGLLGPNGAGKTTTIGMLNTTVTPTSGRACLGGIDVAVDPMGTRAMTSVVFQDTVVDQPLTGRQNLQLHMKLWGVDPTEGKSRFDELTRTVGIADIVDRVVSTYSSGQRRRMEIVRALLSAPEVLFLDEPTVGLDTRIRHDLFDIIATLRDRTGVTIIMTTHYLDEAERLCDRIGVVDAGRLVACDTPANLLAMVGDEVLELRVDDAEASSELLQRGGLAADDLLAIGGTLTVSLRGLPGASVLALLAERSIPVRSVTSRPPSLDDVYLHLTGGRMTADAA
jgi:ABC-2 type transport system ATP-binding protein